MRHSTNPTGLTAGYKANVIPSRAEAVVDMRFLPGLETEADDVVAKLAGPGVDVEDLYRNRALEAPLDAAIVDAMTTALLAEDPGAAVLPYMLSGGTDNKHLAELGITGYGFAPLRLPSNLDFAAMFHGVDERVPVDALRFGVRVLDRFLDVC